LTLGELLSERAGQHGRRVCIKFNDRRITYADLDRQVSLCAGGLASAGLKHQDRVAILMKNCPEYILSYFAIVRAGGIAVPVNTFLTPSEIIYILKDSGCTLMIHDDSFSEQVKQVREGIPDLDTCLFTDIKKEEYINKSRSSGNDLAVLLYTSGTTGFPKGAMLSHDNLFSNAAAIMEVVHLTASDRILLFLPLFHSFSFTVCVILPIYAGAQTVLLESVKPFSRVVNSVVRDRITFFVAIPTIYTILSRKKVPLYLRLALKIILAVRACISGAAALPETTIRSFEERFGIPLIEGYGLTEASPVVAVNPLRGVKKATSVGPPLPGVETAVIDEKGERMPVGEVGELLVKGPNVMQGYYQKEKETASALKEGWLHTGDLAKIDEDGYIYIVDRKKDLIIIDGMNVYPREVEEHVMKQGDVEECAMVGIPDGKGSELSVLFVRLKEDGRADEGAIRDFCKGGIARYKIPRRIVFIDDFPRTSTGKIRKTELRKWQL
jgi:long-chain acyl-CoA synthetase